MTDSHRLWQEVSSTFTTTPLLILMQENRQLKTMLMYGHRMRADSIKIGITSLTVSVDTNSVLFLISRFTYASVSAALTFRVRVSSVT